MTFSGARPVPPAPLVDHNDNSPLNQPEANDSNDLLLERSLAQLKSLNIHIDNFPLKAERSHSGCVVLKSDGDTRIIFRHDGGAQARKFWSVGRAFTIALLDDHVELFHPGGVFAASGAKNILISKATDDLITVRSLNISAAGQSIAIAGESFKEGLDGEFYKVATPTELTYSIKDTPSVLLRALEQCAQQASPGIQAS
jgi:hypothetical protein